MKYSKEIIDKVIFDFNSGINKLQLSKKYNIPRATLNYKKSRSSQNERISCN